MATLSEENYAEAEEEEIPCTEAVEVNAQVKDAIEKNTPLVDVGVNISLVDAVEVRKPLAKTAKVNVPLVESEDAGGDDEKQRLESEEALDTVQGPFSEKTWMEDLTLTVEGKNLYVSKSTLALISPVFLEMIEKDPSQKKIPLYGKRYADFLEFLHCVYPNQKTLHKIDENNVMTVAPLIVEFKIEYLTEACISSLLYLVDNTNSAEDFLYYFLKSSEFGFGSVKQRCLSVLVEKGISELKKTKHFSEVPNELKIELLTHLAEEQTKTIEKQRKVIAEQEESINRFVMIKKYLLYIVRKSLKWVSEKDIDCYVIDYDFCLGLGFKCSDHIKCGSTEVAFSIEKARNGCLETTMHFDPRRAEGYGGPKQVTFVIVNTFSTLKNITLEQTSHFDSPRVWHNPGIEWNTLKSESTSFLKNGKVKIRAYVIM